MSPTLTSGIINQARLEGVQYANQNKVLSTPVAINLGDVTFDVNLKRCRVCVPRTQARGNPVPTYFARIWRNSVDVSACATGEVDTGGGTSCIKPWALPDAFDDANRNGQYDPGEYYQKGVTSYGTDYRANGHDVGTRLTVKQGRPQDAIAPGQYYPVDLPIPDSPLVGSDRYRSNIATCNPSTVSITDMLMTETGRMAGPTKQGVEELIAQDPGASWDSSTNEIVGSNYGATGSPRIIRVPFFDPRNPPSPGKQSIEVTNIASLFLEDIDGNGTVHGRVMLATGIGVGTTPGGLLSVRLVE
jgi:hypothetical protein